MTNNVFYSVCPFGTGDIKVACNISIAGGGGVATFSVAQTGNIGVGCHVISDNIDGFISEITSTTSAIIVTALGVAHGDVSLEALTSIAHEYASLSAFEAGFTDANHVNNTDLTSADVKVHACIYYDHDDYTADTTAETTIDFGTSDATRNLKILTPQGGTESINNQRHSGIYNNQKARYETTGEGIYIFQEFVELEGLQIQMTSSASVKRGIYVSGIVTSTIKISKNIIKGVFTGTGTHIAIRMSDSDGTYYVSNNIIYDFDISGAIGIQCSGSSGTYNLYQNTVINCSLGIVGAGTTRAKNNVCFACTDGYSGTIGTALNNAFDEGSDPGSDGIDISSYAGTDLFNDYNNDDFGLKTGSPLLDTGVSLLADAYLVISDDIVDTERPQNSIFDAGAFEFVESGGSTLLPNKCSIVIAGYNVTVSTGDVITVSKGDVLTTGLSANISAGKTISAAVGSVSISGINPSISAGKTISSGVGAIVATGVQASISTGATISVTLGAVFVSGVQANISAGKTIAVTTESIIVTSINALISSANIINCSIGSIVVSGFNVNISAGTTISVTTENVTIAGINVDVSAGTTVTVSSGVLSITGFSVDITHTILIEVTTGVITILGLVPRIVSGEVLAVPTERTYVVSLENREAIVEEEIRACSITAGLRVYTLT